MTSDVFDLKAVAKTMNSNWNAKTNVSYSLNKKSQEVPVKWLTHSCQPQYDKQWKIRKLLISTPRWLVMTTDGHKTKPGCIQTFVCSIDLISIQHHFSRHVFIDKRENVMTLTRFLHYWPFGRKIHQSPVYSPYKRPVQHRVYAYSARWPLQHRHMNVSYLNDPNLLT